MNYQAGYNALMPMASGFGDQKNVNAGRGTLTQQMMQLGGQVASAAVMGGMPLPFGGGQPTAGTPSGNNAYYGNAAMQSMPQMPGWGMPVPLPAGPTMASTGGINLIPYGQQPAPNLIFGGF